MFEIPKTMSPRVPTLKIDVISLTFAQVKAMSDTELLALLSGESGQKGMIPVSAQQLITSELLARNLAKGSNPHWSVVPSFWILVLTAILALVAATAAILSLPQVQNKFFGEQSGHAQEFKNQNAGERSAQDETHPSNHP